MDLEDRLRLRELLLGDDDRVRKLAEVIQGEHADPVVQQLTVISEHASALATDLAEQIAPVGWAPYRTSGEPSASGHIISLRHPAAAADQVQAGLASQHNININSELTDSGGYPYTPTAGARDSRPRASAKGCPPGAETE
jgi:hypothetical protein